MIHLGTCGLIYDYHLRMYCWMVGCLENDEMWRFRKEELLSEVLPYHMQGGAEEYCETRLSG